jgi:hypothetical protein
VVLNNNLVSKPTISDFQKLEVNFVSLSDIISLGMPVQSEHLFHEYLCDIYRLAGRFDGDEMSGLAQFIHYYHNGVILFG